MIDIGIMGLAKSGRTTVFNALTKSKVDTEGLASGEMFLPEVLLSAEVMHRGLNILNPLLAKSGQKGMGKLVVGTVEGDIHDIGKRIVGSLLKVMGLK